MTYNMIYEIQWRQSPEAWFMNIFFLVAAILAILKSIDHWKGREKGTAIIFIVVAITVTIFSSVNFYHNWKYDMNEGNYYVEAYENGEYKTVEGKVSDFTKARHGYYFYIGDKCFDYEGPKLEEGALVKVYYIDEGAETYYLVRVDLCEENS